MSKAVNSGANRELQPIFILGMLPRSGTNYLFDLLEKHPGCCRASVPVYEDFFVDQLGRVDQLVTALRASWGTEWQVSGEQIVALYRHIGAGLLGFLTEQHSTSQRLLTKTPSVRNLARFHELFPQAQLLLLVRDGRAVMESSRRSFGWLTGEALYRWVGAARKVLAFRDSALAESRPVMLVRYEDLVAQPELALREILAFLELDQEQYPFDQIKGIPVRGSSQSAEGGQRVSWQSRASSPAFAPLNRWSDWRRYQHERFNFEAGRESVALGYPLEAFTGGQGFWWAWNWLAQPWRLTRRGLDGCLRALAWSVRTRVSGRRWDQLVALKKRIIDRRGSAAV